MTQILCHLTGYSITQSTIVSLLHFYIPSKIWSILNHISCFFLTSSYLLDFGQLWRQSLSIYLAANQELMISNGPIKHSEQTYIEQSNIERKAISRKSFIQLSNHRKQLQSGFYVSGRDFRHSNISFISYNDNDNNNNKRHIDLANCICHNYL